MGTVHDLIEHKGRAEALRASDTFSRREVEAAAAYMAHESAGIGFLYSGWCQAALPHRRLPDSQGWQITSEQVTLIVQPGMIEGEREPRYVGIPYGSRARLIMLYLQSEALRTGNRQIHLGRSMRDWLARMGVPWGGKSGEAVRDQAGRISLCRLTFRGRALGMTHMNNENIVDEAIFLDQGPPGQAALFPEVAQLSERFFERLQKHSVPLEEAAIRAISNNSMALDLYAWLAYRLHVLKAPCPIGWLSLKKQFGLGFSLMYHFRPSFTDNLRLATAVYRDARIELDDSGVTLFPSPPPVRPKQVALRPVCPSLLA